MTIQQAPPDDAALLLRARSGDGDAIGVLYETYYDAGRRFASSLAGADAAEDLVADVWAKVLTLLESGRGPQDNFRAYLFTSIRNRFYDKMRVAGRERPASDEPWLLDDITPPSDEIVEEYDDDRAVAALQTLPDRWQKMLWQLEVEGRSIPEVADIHDVDVAAVSSAAYRAREGLRAAYLDQQINGHMYADDRDCTWVRKRMSRFVRSAASARAAERISAHAEVCNECQGILLELQSTNKKFGLLVLPILLVGVTSGTKAALWWGGAGITGAISALWGRLWDAVRTPAGGVVAASMILALAGPGVLWGIQQGREDAAPPAAEQEASADPPATDPAPSGTPPSDTPPTDRPRSDAPATEAAVEQGTEPAPAAPPAEEPDPKPEPGAGPDPAPAPDPAPEAEPAAEPVPAEPGGPGNGPASDGPPGQADGLPGIGPDNSGAPGHDDGHPGDGPDGNGPPGLTGN